MSYRKSSNKRIRNITVGVGTVGDVGRNYKHDCKKRRIVLIAAEEIDALYVAL